MHVHVWTHAIEHTSKRDERINGPQDEGWRALYTIRQMNAWVWLYISWPGKHDHTHLRKHVSGLGFVRSRSGRWVALCTYPLKMWVIVIGPDRRQASHCLMTCWIFWRNLAVFFPDWSSGFTCCRSTKKKGDTDILNPKWTLPVVLHAHQNPHRLAKAARHQHFGTRVFFSFLSIFPKVIVKNGCVVPWDHLLDIEFASVFCDVRRAVIMPMRA